MPELENQGQEQGQPAQQQSNAAPAAPSQNPTGNSEGTPNQQGEKLFAGKYKSAEDLEKGYSEATKFGREQAALVKDLQGKMPKAPEKYVFDFSKTEDLKDVTIDPEAPDLAPMIPVFKELNLSQEQVGKLAEAWVRTQSSLAPTPEKIKEELGANADVMLSRLQAFTNKLPLADQQVISQLSGSAANIDFMYRHFVGEELPVPANTGGGGAPQQTAAELKSAAFKYKADNSRSISWDKGQQETYTKMMNAALIAEENEKKAKK